MYHLMLWCWWWCVCAFKNQRNFRIPFYHPIFIILRKLFQNFKLNACTQC
ncbi:hypothetical protein MGQ_02384 [Candida albicans P76067]|nr:hypothetical protein MEO_02391 [Candida albicans P94015]KGU29052.1 hypothetical protein MG7_02404 [Candida albicans P34048]KGU33074.1 hypothetical protein MGM_02435 [Candida albicans P75063]KGU35571.1 hypothetical protein MGK_02391 [Candida albicans P57055]KHC38589.1 hypothetical protein MGO_02370 [Candida albicans P76055]KHC40033.1 hypothetical protein MGQ_02384 [Candida albicans P76067]KHC44707.1 hypothetical protein W5O_02397 [Candida albicans Ca6]KHC72877.1 hypothetical protein MGI_02